MREDAVNIETGLQIDFGRTALGIDPGHVQNRRNSVVLTDNDTAYLELSRRKDDVDRIEIGFDIVAGGGWMV